ncbi:ABC transporter substrate-binding protein [Citreimonas salinaria]|uniref:Peptide/nickel transport system substrate-binding protein n=1 Tax=Citreimonas salinaria TaxID=321339 RepID=A0A1H3KDU3_9RHOB|nr:ABC transporter substrate-binding protein [Citreimonas salinaria]SDY50253.1 peptide/nickel transport system substrate-binding protein [Citreimonas salinaria]
MTRHLTLAALLLSGTAAMAQQTDLTIALQLEPPHLDPTSAAAGAIDQVLYSNVFEGLTRFTETGAVEPGLASDWEISEDGLTYTFTLQDGVTFHDGTDLTAEDVVFSFERAMAEDSQNAQKVLFENIDTVEAVDPQTVRLTLSQPDGSLLFNLAWGDAVIVAPESIDTIKSDPVGTGPFQFDEWIQGDRITLERYEDYWGEAPALTEATFQFISDPTAAFAAMMAQDIDAFYSYPAPENLPQFAADPRFQVLEGSTEGETILGINNQQKPLNDVRVRQAIAHAIDRQAVINGAMFGQGTPIGTHFAPHHPDYVDLLELSPHDPERARELLAEAGYPDGFTTTLKLPPPSYARRGGEIIASQLREVGIETEITNLEWAQWLEEVFRGRDFGLTIVSHTEPMDINIYARPDYYFGYDNPAFQDVMERLGATADPDERGNLLAEAQRIIAEDYVNAYLFQLGVATVADARIEGLWTNAPTQAVDLTDVRWTE